MTMSNINDFLLDRGLRIAQNPCISPDFCLDWPGLRARLLAAGPVLFHPLSAVRTALGEFKLGEDETGDHAWLLRGDAARARAALSDGVARALTQSGREGVTVGQGCDDIGIAATRVPVAEDHFLGCVAFFPEKYPDYAISIAADVLEGKPVPQEVHLQHVFLDENTIDDVYPETAG